MLIAEVLIHGMYGTQFTRHSTENSPWSGVFGDETKWQETTRNIKLLRKDAELMPQYAGLNYTHETSASQMVHQYSVLYRFFLLSVIRFKVVRVGDIFLIHSDADVLPGPWVPLLRLIRNEWNQVAHKLAAASFHVIAPWIL